RQSNCGWVTPGVLCFSLPHLANVTSFSLGLSCSITDEDLFAFLGQLPCLETLELQYYLQLNSPRIGPRLPRLHSFTACHPSINTAPGAASLCSWIRRIIARAPLVHLRLLCDSLNRRTHNAHVALTGLVEHLAAVHTATLRTLDLGGALLGVSALTLLYGACTALEELRAGLGVRGFVHVRRGDPPHLHTAVVRVLNAPHRALVVSAAEAGEIMRSSAALRRLAVDDARWEGSWTSQDGGVEFVVGEWRVPTDIAYFTTILRKE
ncbi:hypothetical protein B0H10DRAFT_1801525, partial [Mycena sp. CBHHK59/15]